MTTEGGSRIHERWAQLRFSVIGHLLAAPPAAGTLRGELQKLAARQWRHPSTGEPVRFGVSTIERWLYCARRERHDSVGVLKRKRRKDAGSQDSMSAAVRAALRAQYAAHPTPAIELELVSHNESLALQVLTSAPLVNPTVKSIDERITAALIDASHPLSVSQPRPLCRVRKATLCERLTALTAGGHLHREADGYRIAVKR